MLSLVDAAVRVDGPPTSTALNPFCVIMLGAQGPSTEGSEQRMLLQALRRSRDLTLCTRTRSRGKLALEDLDSEKLQQRRRRPQDLLIPLPRPL